MAIKITDQNFEEIVKKTDKLSVVDFWAEWCGPCKTLVPIIEEVANEMGDKVIIGKLNVDENPDTSEKYGIRSIPTILFFKGSEVVDKQIGLLTKIDLINKINSLL